MSPPQEAEERKKEEKIAAEEEFSAETALLYPKEKRGLPLEEIRGRISLPTAAETTFLKRKPLKVGEVPPFHIDMRPKLIKLPPFKEKEKIDIRYPLLPPYAFAHIYWDKKNNELVYHVREPELNETEKEILRLLQLGLEEMINISFVRAKKTHVIIEYLEKNVQSILAELGTKVSGDTYLKLMYYVYRNSVGLNQIEPLINDYYIEDIECNGIGYPIYIVHRVYQNLRTNVIFNEPDEMTNFVEKLAQKAGRYVSYAKPLLDGTLPDGSRVNAVYTEDVTTRGPTFTIRKFTKEPWTPVQLVNFKTASSEVFAFLWIAIEHKFNIMVIGETASGKTSFLNSVINFVPPEARICSIEDTRELNLAHINWLPAVTRAGFGIPTKEGVQYGEITLFDLLRETFRQNPDYVVVGEVRGKEAYVLFQGMASGHPSFATFHAASVDTLVRRLETPPLNLPASLVETLDIVCVTTHIKTAARNIRRLTELDEIISVGEGGKVKMNKLFVWDPLKDTFSFTKDSVIFKKISERTGLTHEGLLKELNLRVKVLSKMLELGITHFKPVSEMFNLYYKNKEEALKKLGL
jgi:flagellar protein FlaI